MIGAGPAGEKAAAQAGALGKRVVLVDGASTSGATGVAAGTIPSRTLRETALYFSGLRQRGLAALDVAIRKDLALQDFMYHPREATRFGEDVHRLRGRAAFEDAHTVRIVAADTADRVVEGDVVLVATGSVPRRTRDVPFDDPRIWDTDRVLGLPRIPRTMTVIGTDVVGCEYATIFAGLGIFVTLIHDGDRLLPFLDAELSEHLRTAMELLGMEVRLDDHVVRYGLDGAPVRLELAGGASVKAESVLVAAGRLGNTTGLGLERIGIALDASGHVPVNEHYQTTLPHVYAAGDVTPFPPLAVTPTEQGRLAVLHAFDARTRKRASPSPLAVYTIPEIAMIGETEESCRAKGIAYRVGKARYQPPGRAHTDGDLAGAVKLVFGVPDRRLLGVHVIGESAVELVEIGAMILRAGGTLDSFIDGLHDYPAFGEAYRDAAYDGLERLTR